MSYDDLLPWRALAQLIPKDVLIPTHRLIIVTLMTYESHDKGAFFTSEHIASELGLTYRAVLANFHYLGSGLVWKNGIRQPCLNPAHKVHLGIIKTSYYACANKAQNYRIDMKAIEALASVHVRAPKESSMQPSVELHAPGSVERAPEGSSVCTDMHPYKHNKQLINVINGKNTFRFDELTQAIPKHLQNSFTPGANLEVLLNQLEHEGTTLEAICAHIRRNNWGGANSAGGIVQKLLTQLLADTKASNTRAQQEKLKSQKEQREQERHDQEKASPKNVKLYANEARRAMQNKH